jgi:nucleoside-diphosphate-sugar epimerase
MKVFVTGASGFVGGAAVRRFVAAGYEVMAMSRSDEADDRIRALGATPVCCDLQTVAATDIKGADIVVHAAAFMGPWATDEVWEKTNVTGTKRMLAASSSAHVRRFIHISTDAVVFHGQHIHDGDETMPLALHSPYPYCRSTARAEKAVIEANGFPKGFETIVLRPRLVWGPGDGTLLLAIRKAVSTGNWPWVDHGLAFTSTTHIENLTDAILLAVDQGRPAQAYFIMDEGRRLLRDIIAGIAEADGLTLPERSLPHGLAAFLAGAAEFYCRHIRPNATPPLTRHEVAYMSRDCTLSSTKAEAALGYVPRISVEEGLRQLASGGQGLHPCIPLGLGAPDPH